MDDNDGTSLPANTVCAATGNITAWDGGRPLDLKWLEDFLALVEHGSFTKAAEARFVSQPAFSRRIRALENWLGVELIDRNAYPTRLTALGEEYTEAIRELVARTYRLRSEMRARDAAGDRLVVSTQHSLSVTFCPRWFGEIRPLLGENSIRVKAHNLHDCLDQFLSGQSDLLLCYYSPDVYPELERSDLARLELGTEQLIPVASPALAAGGGRRYPLVGFPSESFFGRLVQTECIPATRDSGVEFELIFETALSESARALSLEGTGLAWLPASLVRRDLEEGRLARVPDLPAVAMQVVLIMNRANRKKVLHAIWDYMESAHAGMLSVAP